MASIITTIADAVVAAMNGPTFSRAFTAQRSYLPIFDLKDMVDLHVTVVPKAVSSEASSRNASQEEYQIDVAVQQKVASLEPVSIDPLMAIVQEIVDFWRLRRVMIGALPAVCIKASNLPVYAPEHLSQMNQFTSIVTLTFRMVRQWQ